jgi:hypothetical protein
MLLFALLEQIGLRGHTNSHDNPHFSFVGDQVEGVKPEQSGQAVRRMSAGATKAAIEGAIGSGREQSDSLIGVTQISRAGFEEWTTNACGVASLVRGGIDMLSLRQSAAVPTVLS